jgi:hypothetical protein
MKRIYLLLIHLILLSYSTYTFADYPIVKYRYLADPGAFVHNGRVYVYCSNDDDNGDASYDMHTIVCVSSSDLKNWTDHGVVFNVPRDAGWTGLSWAPSPAYKNGKFYLYFGNGGSAIGVAVSDSPTGPFKDPVGRNIANSNTPGVQPFNGWLFDPMTFVDDDGQAYMYFGGNGDGNLRVAKLNNDMVSINGSVGKFNVPNFFEAAWMHKYNGKYYFSYSTTPSAGMRIDYMVSNNPMSGFTYGGVISQQPPNNNNNNHHSIVFFNNQWYQIYHNRIVAQQNGHNMPYHRNLAIDKFDHRADGTIIQMVNTVDGVKQTKYLDPFVRVEAETMSDQNGIETEVCSAGGMNVGFIDNGDWTMVEGVDFGSGASVFSASVASTKTGGTIEVRTGSATGTLLGTLQVPNTGGLQTWKTVTTSLTQTTGVKNVYFVFKGSGSSMFNFDHWSFLSKGPVVSITAPLSTSEIYAGDNVTITATAQAQSGSISKVEFFIDGKSIGVDNTPPYSFIYSNVTKGSHVIEVVATDSQGDKGSAKLDIKVNVPQGPYNGTWHVIPGTIQLENYDVGGNGIAYMDDSPGSSVTPTVNFRTDEDVDIENCTDVGGGYNIGFATAGEWLEYSVDVEKPGTYDLDLRVAADGTGRTVSVSMDGVNIASNVAIPNTGGWQAWQTTTVKNIDLKAGKQILRVTIGATDYVNLNYVTFKLIKELKQEPYNGIAHQIPGRIQAEDYDLGGEGLAFHEANVEANEGGADYRTDHVDIEETQDTDGAYNIAYIMQGEWLEYTVNVTSDGIYDLDLRMAADGDGKTLHIEMDGNDVSGAINVPNTGGWQTWQTVTVNGVSLTAGEHIMRIAFDASYMNLNYVEFRDVITGMHNEISEEVNVYPNPFTEGLMISTSGNFTYRITDLSGVILEEGSGYSLKKIGNTLCKGVYFLLIEKNNNISVKKIINQ